MTYASRDGRLKTRAMGVPRPEPRVETAIRALDRAASRYAREFEAWCAFMERFDPDGLLDWADDVEIVKQRLGLRAEDVLVTLDYMKMRLKTAEEADAAALRALKLTRPRTEASRAAYRGAIDRYVRRPTGDPLEGELALGRLEGAALAA